MKNLTGNHNSKTSLIILWMIIIAGILVRLYYNIGHVFSDDAYYTVLSLKLLDGDFPGDYLGYPVFPLRLAHLLVTAIFFKVFGFNEFATLAFPFLISIGNILLAYKLTKLLTGDESISITASFLMAFFPTDIIFATINFVDSPNMFFINLGIYFLIKSYKHSVTSMAIVGGFFLFISMQFKENIYYISILFIILLIYFLLKTKRINLQLMIGLLFIGSNIFIEGIVYFLLHNDFFYRITITQINYEFSYYDFFPYTAQRFSGSKDFWRNLIEQIFLINGKSVFLRRFYLFLPLVASIQSFFNIRKKEHLLLTFWFIGTVILMIAFTTSFSEYKPLDLRRSWYIYPALMPAIILSGIFISRLKTFWKIGLIVIYLTGSLIMCRHYEIFFDKDNLNRLKNFLHSSSSHNIFTDHFTKYSVDLIRGDNDSQYSKMILGEDFKCDNINSGDWILYNKKHIEELEMQKFQFPDFNILKSGSYVKKTSFGDFVFYEKKF